MKKKGLLVLAAFIAVFVFGKFCYAADKFATIDLIKILNGYKKAVDYSKDIENKKKGYQADIDKKLKDYQDYTQKFDLFSDKEKEAKKSELEQKAKTLDEYVKGKDMELRKEQDEKARVIIKDIDDVINQYASKEGYTIVFDARVLKYQAKGLDITDTVLNNLNKGGK